MSKTKFIPDFQYEWTCDKCQKKGLGMNTLTEHQASILSCLEELQQHLFQQVETTLKKQRDLLEYCRGLRRYTD